MLKLIAQQDSKKKIDNDKKSKQKKIIKQKNYLRKINLRDYIDSDSETEEEINSSKNTKEIQK